MTNPADPSQANKPMKPRALTYTEMMNGGRQQMDEAEHAREQELQQRVDALEDVDQLEQALGAGLIGNARRHLQIELLDANGIPALVHTYLRRELWRNGISSMSESCRDGAVAVCMTCQYLAYGVDQHCRTMVGCNLRQRQLQGEHLKKRCKLWSPTSQQAFGQRRRLRLVKQQLDWLFS